ncbi:MAG: hypothetical protein ACLPUG_13675 [Acidimicrobiales bacterium]
MTLVSMAPRDAPALALPARPSAADYRQAVGLAPARGGDDPAVPISLERLGWDRYRVTCHCCRTRTETLTWQGANSAAIAHRCAHARADHNEPNRPPRDPVASLPA